MTGKKNNDDGAAPKRRRDRGDGALYWDEKRQRWIAEITIGYRPNGKRITRKKSDPNKTGAQKKLKELQRELEEGAPLDIGRYTVADAVRDFLTHGLHGRSPATVEKLTILADEHVIPYFEARRASDLTADEVDEWLVKKAEVLATRTLRELRSLLRRSLNRAKRRNKVRQNVVLLCDDLPEGREGRPSKSLTRAQAYAFLEAASRSWLFAYFVLALLTGARTEELRALMWKHVDLVGHVNADPPVPPHIMVWRSVRAKGETKTKKSRRTLALAALAVAVLSRHGELQNLWRAQTHRTWGEDDLVFVNYEGNPLDAANVRRELRRVLKDAAAANPSLGINPDEWTTRELRHSFVSLLSDHGLSLEDIARLVGHSGTSVTETVYRHQIRPVIERGAQAMDQLFPHHPDAA